jgi:hypothetical protein
MSFYVSSPYKPVPTLMTQGTPTYAFGSFQTDASSTRGYVLSNSAITITGTLVFQVVEGNAPQVGQLITVIGTSNSGGVFNTTNSQILTATTNAQGVATVTYAISSTTQASTADGGQVLVPVIELGDALTSSGGASVPVVCPASPSQQSGKSLSAKVNLPSQQGGVPSTLSGVTVVIQGSNFDLDSSYNTIGVVGTGLAAGTVTDWQSGQGITTAGTLAAGSVNLPNFRFYRLNVTSATGSGPIVGAIMI